MTRIFPFSKRFHKHFHTDIPTYREAFVRVRALEQVINSRKSYYFKIYCYFFLTLV